MLSINKSIFDFHVRKQRKTKQKQATEALKSKQGNKQISKNWTGAPVGKRHLHGLFI